MGEEGGPPPLGVIKPPPPPLRVKASLPSFRVKVPSLHYSGSIYSRHHCSRPTRSHRSRLTHSCRSLCADAHRSRSTRPTVAMPEVDPTNSRSRLRSTRSCCSLCTAIRRRPRLTHSLRAATRHRPSRLTCSHRSCRPRSTRSLYTRGPKAHTEREL
jgi:hypothetical protein